MAKSVFQIEMDFIRAKEQASELEAIAQRICKLSSTTMESNKAQISANWKGENASAYINKYSILQTKVGKNAEELQKAAQTIRIIAGQTYQAEMAAAMIAQN